MGILDVAENDDLMIVCQSGILIRTSISSIREAGRATQGVTLINLDDNDSIAGVVKIANMGGEQDNDDTEIKNDDTEPQTTLE